LTNGSLLSDIANGYLFYGLHKYPDKWVFREWAPKATEIYLIGDFNNWRPDIKYALIQSYNGNWEIELPLSALKHGSLYKLWMK